MSRSVSGTANRHRRWIVATCVALVLAAIGDAGPEIIAAGSVVTGYDGPGPLIYLAVAAAVATLRWRYAPLLAVVMSGFFLVGGLADTEFTSRLAAPAETVTFLAAWLQVLSFSAALAFGLAAVRRRS
ncbi:hypothetical protein [Pseudonocardia kunmingensis]|uniref:hypothetical protein n=1 Tax=Pseudonocardia kunmingensis TaxID=630975 RepID=UPI001153712F|nr:hypothetical protein [Pseudonocardia kunmingensis]